MNPTWYAQSTSGAAVVLQRVNPVFSAEVNIDIAAVTEHLAKKGLLTPRLVPTRAGALWFEHEGIWRVLTRIDGVCFDALEAPSQARAAGRIVAEFHRALAGFTIGRRYGEGGGRAEHWNRQNEGRSPHGAESPEL